jgi:hypothetical protein
MDYLLAILSLGILCAIWGIAQIQIKKYRPDRAEYQSGCAACSSVDCKKK